MPEPDALACPLCGSTTLEVRAGDGEALEVRCPACPDAVPHRVSATLRLDEARPPADPDLVAALTRWRNDVADAEDVPRYLVLQNRTLEELARHRPRSRAALMDVHGVGPVKADRYGDEVLEVLAEAEVTA